jgi:hypothetical protein
LYIDVHANRLSSGEIALDLALIFTGHIDNRDGEINSKTPKAVARLLHPTLRLAQLARSGVFTLLKSAPRLSG